MMANCPMRAPGESIGTFALEIGAGRARGRDGPGPDRAAAPHRAREGPDLGHAASPSRHLMKAYRDGAERFGWDRRRPDARHAARRRMAGGHGRGDRHLPLLSHAGWRRAHPAHRRRARGGADGAATRWAWAPPRCRRSTPPSGWACRWTRCASSTATRTCPPARSPAAPRRRPRSRPPSPLRTRSWSASC